MTNWVVVHQHILDAASFTEDGELVPYVSVDDWQATGASDWTIVSGSTISIAECSYKTKYFAGEFARLAAVKANVHVYATQAHAVAQVKSKGTRWIHSCEYEWPHARAVDSRFMLAPFLIHEEGTSRSSASSASVKVVLADAQMAEWKERLDGLIAALRRVGNQHSVLAYGSLDSVVVELGPKERPLRIVLDEEGTEWSFRVDPDNFQNYKTGAMSLVPTDMELVEILQAYSAQPQRCKQQTKTDLLPTKSLSAVAFSNQSLVLS